MAGAPFPPKDVALRATPSTGPQLLDRVRKDHTAPQTELANGQTPRERLILIQYFLRVLRRRALESVADGGMYGDMQLFGSLQLTDPQYCPASNCKDSENRGR